MLGNAHKNLFKLRFYSRRMIQLSLRRQTVAKSLRRASDQDMENLLNRLDYYNRLSQSFDTGRNATNLDALRKRKKTTQVLDLQHVFLPFPNNLRLEYALGDITHIPSIPTFLKSRPIEKGNQFSVLLKINEIRHYYWRRDPYSFEEKSAQGVWRGACHQPHRKAFIRNAQEAELADLGDVRESSIGTAEHASFMTPLQQMRYKFIISLEGNDVATNLKWIMRSNSLCLMPKPRFESWFMEGRLIAGYHYVEITDDPESLDATIEYYSKNAEKAQEIIQNANAYADQFYETRREALLQQLVALKYFVLSGQMDLDPKLPKVIRDHFTTDSYKAS